jgi:uncharacterized protein YhhL (DUF1145 family)
MSYPKMACIVLWLVLLSAFFVLPDDSRGGQIGRIAFFITAGAHVVEFFIYRPTLQRAEGSLGHHFIQVLIFGMFHYQEIEAELAAKNRGS